VPVASAAISFIIFMAESTTTTWATNQTRAGSSSAHSDTRRTTAHGARHRALRLDLPSLDLIACLDAHLDNLRSTCSARTVARQGTPEPTPHQTRPRAPGRD
jgi:hypothetical protein